MEQHKLEALLAWQLQSRGLRRVEDRMAFVHRGQVVEIKVGATIYRGYFIAVMNRGHKVREFRAGAAGFDWSAVAAAITGVAQARVVEQRARSNVYALSSRTHAARHDLWSVPGAGALKPSIDGMHELVPGLLASL